MVSVTKRTLLQGLVVVMKYRYLYPVTKNQTSALCILLISLSGKSWPEPDFLDPLSATSSRVVNLFSCHHSLLS